MLEMHGAISSIVRNAWLFNKYNFHLQKLGEAKQA